MSIATSTYKALIITTFLSTVVVILGFTLQVKKQPHLVAETFYEVESEPIEEESKEELEDIIKSLDNLLNTTSTNQAYNETKQYEAPDEKAFNERLEEIRNRNTIENSQESSKNNNSSNNKNESNTEDDSAFSEINDLISEKKRTASGGSSNVNKNSSISYSLANRTKIEIPPPVYLCEKSGKIVINITVDASGNVIDTYFNNASTSKDGCMVDHALEYAKAAKFNADASKPSQLGSITFYFKGK